MIDTKLLRQKILDLAIRGKLVPQDPNDEPACELLKKIKAEKEALIKAGKLKRDKHESFIFQGDDKRYYEQIDGKTTDITDEIPFDLPKGWAWCRLQNLCKSIIDGDHQPPPQTSSGIPFLVISNVSDGKLSFHHTRFVSEEYFSGLAESRIPHRDDILLTVTGSYGIAILIEVETKFCFQRHISLLKTINTNNHFLTRWLQTETIKKQFDKSVTGTAQQTLGLNVLRTTLLPLPPLSEQKRIVTQIESLLKCVDEIDRESETLEKSITLAKQKILDLAIRGKLVPQNPKDESASELLKKIKAEKEALIKAGKLKRDKHESFIFRGDDNCYHENIDGKITDLPEEIPFELPKGWAWCRLKEFGNILYGVSESAKQNGRYKLLRITDIQNDRVNWKTVPYTDISEDATTYFLRDGDIVFARTGATVGKSFLIDSAPANAIYASYLIRVRFCFPSLAKFIKQFFGSSDYWNQIIAKSVGTGQPNVNGTSLSELLLPLPPLAEQKRIVSQVEKFFSVLETMRG